MEFNVQERIDAHEKEIAESGKTVEPFVLVLPDERIEFPRYLDTYSLILFSEGALRESLTALIGEERFVQATQALPGFMLDDLLTEYVRENGFDNLGESSASSGLSNRTARRSKPTSKGSTDSTSRPA